MSVTCSICNEEFSTRFNLNRHMTHMHKLSSVPVEYENTWSFKCWESDCHSSFSLGKALIEHLRKSHEFDVDTENIVMNDLAEFAVWKSDVERKYNCSYVFKRKYKPTAGGVISYYNCNRTGVYMNRTGNTLYSRQMKSQGSCKLNYSCISQIKLIQSETINVIWIKTHYKHDNNLAHIRIPKEDRQLVAAKLINGVRPQKILETTRDNIEMNLKRLDLLTSKDITNIKKSFNVDIADGRLHTNDAISVDLWVQGCYANEGKENPVLFYKRQNEESDILRKPDFCLILMNSFQKIMFQQFGQNVIAIDGTHGLNGYDFELVTIMVVDEFQQGFPVAFMFTNRKDSLIYSLFFNTIKSTIGSIKARIFMSDLDLTFYNAWLKIMGPVSHQLFCSWHVDRAWQSNLNKIQNLDARKDIYKYLKTLQRETDAESFEHKLQIFLEFMVSDQETENFAVYFRQYYGNNFKKWAYCFRIDCGINTNMYLESMHKTIKYFYLERKTVKRLDKGLHVVMKFVRDKSVERIIKLTKGKHTKYTRTNFNRHNKALHMNNRIEPCGDMSWKIFRDLKTGDSYMVVKQVDVNKGCCHVICSDCKICLHMYICNCHDYLNNSVICKHIHYALMAVKVTCNDNLDQHQHAQSNVSDTYMPALVSGKECNGRSNNNTDLTQMISSTFCKLQNLNFNNMDTAVLTQISQQLKVVNSLIQLPMTQIDKTVFTTSTASSSQQYIQPQLRFNSTKKKRKLGTTMFEQPSNREATNIASYLNSNIGTELFISCDSAHDHSYIYHRSETVELRKKEHQKKQPKNSQNQKCNNVQGVPFKITRLTSTSGIPRITTISNIFTCGSTRYIVSLSS